MDGKKENEWKMITLRNDFHQTEISLKVKLVGEIEGKPLVCLTAHQVEEIHRLCPMWGRCHCSIDGVRGWQEAHIVHEGQLLLPFI